MVRFALGCLMLAAAVLAGAQPAVAQESSGATRIYLEADVAPLSDILRQLARQAGVDIVFAERTVQGRAVSGRFIGDDFEMAIRTVLRGSGLRAERVRPRQYVIVPDIGLGASVPQPQARGTLEGLVLDGADGEVLPGAHVVLVGLDLGTATNTAGYFAIPGLPQGEYRVRVSYVGYRSVELELPVYPTAKLERPIIRLLPQAIQSASVLVEGNDQDRGDLELTPGTARIDMRKARELPSVLGDGDLMAALEWVPGVIRTGEAGGEMVVRGAEAGYNRYLLDGAPVIHPWHAFGLFSIFQPEMLKSARLHKGSLPAEYGGALSAVLDVELRDGERGRPRGMVALSPVSARGYAEMPLTRDVSLMVTARRTLFDLLVTPELRLATGGGLPSFKFGSPLPGQNGERQQDVGYHFYDLGAKLNWRIGSGQRLSLSVYDGGDRLEARAPLASMFGRLPDANDSPTLNLDYSWGNRVVSARYHGLVGPNIFLTGTGYFSGYRTDEGTVHSATDRDPIRSDHHQRVTEVGFRLDADYYLSLEHQLRAGLHVIGRDFESRLRETIAVEGTLPSLDQVDRLSSLEFVAYAQDTWQPVAGWQFQPGLRIEYLTSSNQISLNPRMHVRRTLERERLFLRAGISRQTQSHHRIRDRHRHTPELASDRWIPAGRDVEPASAWQASAGVELLPHRSITLSGEVYGRSLSSVLYPVGRNEPNSAEVGDAAAYVAGNGRAAGIELSASIDRRPWRGGVSYSFGRAFERVPGADFRPARYDAPHQVEAFLTGAIGPWTVAAGGVLRSGYPVVFAAADQEDESIAALTSRRLPAYARVDLSVGYSFTAVGLDWSAQAQAYNLLNRRNTVGLHHSPILAAQEAGVDDMPVLPMISLSARW